MLGSHDYPSIYLRAHSPDPLTGIRPMSLSSDIRQARTTPYNPNPNPMYNYITRHQPHPRRYPTGVRRRDHRRGSDAGARLRCGRDLGARRLLRDRATEGPTLTPNPHL